MVLSISNIVKHCLRVCSGPTKMTGNDLANRSTMKTKHRGHDDALMEKLGGAAFPYYYHPHHPPISEYHHHHHQHHNRNYNEHQHQSKQARASNEGYPKGLYLSGIYVYVLEYMK